MTTRPQLPFSYRDFHDVPRWIAINTQNVSLLLTCTFDVSTDDYADTYVVYRMPADFTPPEDGSWEMLPTRAVARLGVIPVADVEFDPTRRRWISLPTEDEHVSTS